MSSEVFDFGTLFNRLRKCLLLLARTARTGAARGGRGRVPFLLFQVRAAGHEGEVLWKDEGRNRLPRRRGERGPFADDVAAGIAQRHRLFEGLEIWDRGSGFALTRGRRRF